ncbi:MAG: glycine cleavage system aminomethyltransferase GcvT [Nitrospirota bacterium]|nr:glycine cleavage system aminomethyltransferase GcvT [Nitrospirota bacterium]
MKRTPLFEGHGAAGGRLVDFAGWEMPMQYTGVVDEYQTVRNAAGLFDVSHMGRIVVVGEGALSFLQRVTTNNVAKLGVLESQYSMICNETGGIKDDIFVYRMRPQEYLLCVNASNREKIARWLSMQASGVTGVILQDRSAELAQLALQGPASRTILSSMGIAGIEAMKLRACLETHLLGVTAFITRTGYTGELGYELYVPSDHALAIWNELLTVGKSVGLKPAGLGARDLLRLEMAYLLYGNDIGEETTPIEAASEWVVDLKKGDFIGRKILQQQKDNGAAKRLVAFELTQKAVPRHGFKILSGDSSGGKEIGEVTSGNLSPLLQKGIGLGYVPPQTAAIGSSICIDIRGRALPAVITKPPFYRKRATHG